METEKGRHSVPGSPEVGEVGEAPVAEDNQEGAEDVDGKGEQEGVDAQELSSEVPKSQADERQPGKDMFNSFNARSHFLLSYMISFTF